VSLWSGRVDDVADRLDKIEDAMTECLEERVYASADELVQALSSSSRRFASGIRTTRPGDVAAALDVSRFADWLCEGEELGFITYRLVE
jgi:hypothetical protein